MHPYDPSTAPLKGLDNIPVASMFGAINGLRNGRALTAWLGCAVAGVVVSGLLAAMAGVLGGLAFVLAAIVALVAFGTGVNAAGLLQMDQARGVPLRRVADALLDGLRCIPKLIVLGLAFVAVMLVFFLALALVFAVCKIPVLGPILYAVVFPLAVVATGLLLTAVIACMLLSLPAIWEGSPITRALAQTIAIARSRLIETLLLFAVVGVLCFAVAFIVFGVLLNGLMPVLGLSASILGRGGEYTGMGGGFGSMLMMSAAGDGSGYMIAGGIGFALLWSVAGALVGQVYLQGLNLIYLRVTEGLDVGAAEAALKRTMNDAKQRSSELAAKARAAATPAGSSASDDPSTSDSRAMAAAAAYGGHANAPAVHAPPAGGGTPTSSMSSPPAHAAPPAVIPMGTTDLPGATTSAVHGAPSLVEAPLKEQGSPTSSSAQSAAPLDLEFDFDLPGAPANAASHPAWSPSSPRTDPAPTMPLPGFRDLVAKAASTPAWTPAPKPWLASSTAPSQSTVACPKCLSAANPDDVFCGVCGNRLK